MKPTSDKAQNNGRNNYGKSIEWGSSEPQKVANVIVPTKLPVTYLKMVIETIEGDKDGQYLPTK
jgi:hypothetical protein